MTYEDATIEALRRLRQTPAFIQGVLDAANGELPGALRAVKIEPGREEKVIESLIVEMSYRLWAGGFTPEENRQMDADIARIVRKN